MEPQAGSFLSGIITLVPLADLLAELGGSRSEALSIATELVRQGPSAIVKSANDLTMAIHSELQIQGILLPDENVDYVRASELLTLCGILAATTVATPKTGSEPRLVFSAPSDLVIISPEERLEGLVLDVIRRATFRLIIGGAFWNDAGFELLNDVLVPAVHVRQIPTIIYANLPSPPYDALLIDRLDILARERPVEVRWYCGPQPTMLHAKFVIRDGSHGYLGTANLTSWGMQRHIEAGVELGMNQCARFCAFLEQLEKANLFSAT